LMPGVLKFSTYQITISCIEDKPKNAGFNFLASVFIP
jgi:hypothetical protein